jgi:hypothetical protein
MEMWTARASRLYLGRGSARDARCYTKRRHRACLQPTIRLAKAMADTQQKDWVMNPNEVVPTPETTENGRDARSTQEISNEDNRRDAYFARTLPPSSRLWRTRRRPSFINMCFYETNPPILRWKTGVIRQGGSRLWRKNLRKNGGFVLENEPTGRGVLRLNAQLPRVERRQPGRLPYNSETKHADGAAWLQHGDRAVAELEAYGRSACAVGRPAHNGEQKRRA